MYPLPQDLSPPLPAPRVWMTATQLATALHSAARLLAHPQLYKAYTVSEPSAECLLSLGEVCARIARQACTAAARAAGAAAGGGGGRGAGAGAGEVRLWGQGPRNELERELVRVGSEWAAAAGAGAGAGAGADGAGGGDGAAGKKRRRSVADGEESEGEEEEERGGRDRGREGRADREGGEGEGGGGCGGGWPDDVSCMLAAHAFSLLLVACEQQPESLLVGGGCAGSRGRRGLVAPRRCTGRQLWKPPLASQACAPPSMLGL